MKSYEIINEAISLSRYTNVTEMLIMKCIIDALKLPTTDNEIIDEADTIEDLLDVLATSFMDELLTSLPKELKTLCNTTVLGSVKKTVMRPSKKKAVVNATPAPTPQNTVISVSRIRFIKLRDSVDGEALGQVISISIRFLQYCKETYQTLLTAQLPESITLYKNDPNDVKAVLDITRSNKFASIIYNNPRMLTICATLTNILLHEVVHVIQHLQVDRSNNKDPMVHKSYLSNKKLTNKAGQDEFYQKSVAKEFDSRWDRLYHADAREITAYAHNFVQQFIRKYDLNKGNTLPPLNVIAREIPDEVKTRFNPTNNKELKVYNRYLKTIYNELARTYEDVPNQPRRFD